jgi:hypothetical protein
MWIIYTRFVSAFVDAEGYGGLEFFLTYWIIHISACNNEFHVIASILNIKNKILNSKKI